jgi:hypothetical protein
MPALPPYPNVVKVEHLFEVGGDLDALVRWHVAYTGGPPTNADCVALATSIYASLTARLVGFLNTDSDFLGVRVTDLSSSTAGSGEHLFTTTGTRGGESLPANVAVLMSMPIARRYRGGKPRSYWPFFDAGDLLTRQTWEAASVAALTASMALYISDIAIKTSGTTALGGLVSVSYYEGFTSVLNPITGRTRDVPKVRSAAIAPDPILSFSISDEISSQRRRDLRHVS